MEGASSLAAIFGRAGPAGRRLAGRRPLRSAPPLALRRLYRRGCRASGHPDCPWQHCPWERASARPPHRRGPPRARASPARSARAHRRPAGARRPRAASCRREPFPVPISARTAPNPLAPTHSAFPGCGTGRQRGKLVINAIGKWLARLAVPPRALPPDLAKQAMGQNQDLPPEAARRAKTRPDLPSRLKSAGGLTQGYALESMIDTAWGH